METLKAPARKYPIGTVVRIDGTTKLGVVIGHGVGVGGPYTEVQFRGGLKEVFKREVLVFLGSN